MERTTLHIVCGDSRTRAEQAEAEITFLSHGPLSLRADFGLPETGWEDEVRRRHGLL